jgi:hypothetical protein
VRARHLECFADIAAQAAPRLRSPDFQTWMERVVPEWGNMRAAWLHAIESGEVGPTVDLCECGFVSMWVLGRLREVAPLIEATLESPRPLDGARRGRLLLGAALVAYSTGDDDRCARYLDQFDALRSEVSDDALIGAALLYRSFLAATRWDMIEFQQCLDEAEKLLRAAHDTWILGFCIATRGVLAYIQGEHATAEENFSVAVDLAFQSGNEVLALQAQTFRVMVRLAVDDVAGARELLADTLDYIDRYPYWEATAYVYEAAASVAAADGEFERAGRLIGAADALRTITSSVVWALVRSLRDAVVDKTRAAVGTERFEALVQEGAEDGSPRAAAIVRDVVR